MITLFPSLKLSVVCMLSHDSLTASHILIAFACFAWYFIASNVQGVRFELTKALGHRILSPARFSVAPLPNQTLQPLQHKRYHAYMEGPLVDSAVLLYCSCDSLTFFSISRILASTSFASLSSSSRSISKDMSF